VGYRRTQKELLHFLLASISWKIEARTSSKLKAKAKYGIKKKKRGTQKRDPIGLKKLVTLDWERSTLLCYGQKHLNKKILEFRSKGKICFEKQKPRDRTPCERAERRLSSSIGSLIWRKRKYEHPNQKKLQHPGYRPLQRKKYKETLVSTVDFYSGPNRPRFTTIDQIKGHKQFICQKVIVLGA